MHVADDDDDVDLEEWLDLTDEQQTAMLDREMMALQRKLDAMTIPQQVAHHRYFVLKSIMDNRRRLKTPHLCTIPIIVQCWRDGIKRCQKRLLKLRIWRATGTYPGDA